MACTTAVKRDKLYEFC